MLLADHPYFSENVIKIRKQLHIPQNGFTDGQQAYRWEHADKKQKEKLRTATNNLIANFAGIKDALQSEARFFAYDYTISPAIVRYKLPFPDDWENLHREEATRSIGRYKIGVRLFKTESDVERRKYQFIANALYLEITNLTTKRDIDEIAKLVTIKKKDQRPFALPKPQVARRYTWQLFSTKAENKMSNSQIARAVNERFRTRLTPQHVPSYAKEYEKALKKLKPFSNS